jgi:cyclopropane-fatty-acyl-phospholipid synthase
MPVTTGMKGEGFYDQNSSPQWAAIEAVLPWLKTAVSQWELPDSGSPVVVIDYACSEGRNSIAMIDQFHYIQVAALLTRL